MSLTRRPGSGSPRQTSLREDHHIVRNTRVRTTASSTAIQAQRPLRVLPLTLFIDASAWSGAAHEENGLQRNGTRSYLAMNPCLISAVITIVFVCGDPQSCLCFTATHRSHIWCDGMRCRCLQYTVNPSIDPGHHMTAQRYAHDILLPHVLPLMQRLLEAIWDQ
ncbi:HTH_Tnp_Tc3_2 domain-containing protein [Trichonephila clavipes]|nr:HTH_Tnp_Tc3_2 domain-containing protein [Trichonephila clavipes]